VICEDFALSAAGNLISDLLRADEADLKPPLQRFMGFPPNRDVTGDLDSKNLLAGQGVGLVCEIEPAGEICSRVGGRGAAGRDTTPRSGGKIIMSESFESQRAPEPVGAFPHAKRVGNLLFLSGIGPRVRGSKEIPGVTLDAERNIISYDIETQCRAVFQNVRLVLEDAGASWNDIVDVSVFLTNMKKDFPTFNRIYPEYFAGPGKPNPTRTTVQVGALPTPIAIELKVTAAVG
jgi:2-aminomuconate deaminase